MFRLGFIRMTILGAVAIVSFGVLGAALWLWQDRARTLEEGDRTARILAHVLEEQSSRTVQAVDLTLQGIVEALHLSPPLSDHDPAFEDALRRRLATLPYIRALFVIGPDGFITQDSDHPFTPRVSLADRPYFRAHAGDPSLGLHIGPPLMSRSVGTRFVSMSRRLRAPEDRFDGIAVAAIEPRYFANFYEALGLGERDSITLFSRDGTLIARHPHQDGLMGESFADTALFEGLSSGGPPGTFQGTGLFDEVRRIVSYRALDHLPLVVAVGLSEQALLAPWWRKVTEMGVASALLAGLVGTVATLVIRNHRNQEQMQRRLMQAHNLEALGRLTGGVVHDFNNLLGVVTSALRLIESRRSSDPSIAEFARMASAAVGRGTDLTRQLLAFARQQELEVRPLDPNRRIRDLQLLLRGAVGPRATLELDLAPELGRCRLDPTQFDAALLNLAVNARDALPSDGLVRITTANGPSAVQQRRDRWPHGCIRVSIADNGEGMSPETLRRALEPFFTTKGHDGTGLGLSQTYGFVRQIGGDLQIESRPGKGTAVHLFFPKTPPSAEDLPTVATDGTG